LTFKNLKELKKVYNVVEIIRHKVKKFCS
jgi:hypothetical protein